MGIRVRDDGLACNGCGEVVFPGPGPFVITNQVIETLSDGRVHWWSQDFEVTVHLCELPATARAVEQASGLVLHFLATRGAMPAR